MFFLNYDDADYSQHVDYHGDGIFAFYQLLAWVEMWESRFRLFCEIKKLLSSLWMGIDNQLTGNDDWDLFIIISKLSTTSIHSNPTQLVIYELWFLCFECLQRGKAKRYSLDTFADRSKSINLELEVCLTTPQ